MKLLLEMLGMTNQCNMRCTYCDWNKDEYRNLTDTELFNSKQQIREIKKVIDKRFNDVMIVQYSGGEPLLYPKILYDVLEQFKEKWIRINTNGILINDEIITKIKEHGRVYLAVSLDGSTLEANYPRVKGNKKLLDKILTNIELIVKNRIPLMILCTINKYNVREFPEFIKYLSEKYSDAIENGMLVLPAHAVTSYDKDNGAISFQEAIELRNFLVDNFDKYPIINRIKKHYLALISYLLENNRKVKCSIYDWSLSVHFRKNEIINKDGKFLSFGCGMRGVHELGYFDLQDVSSIDIFENKVKEYDKSRMEGVLYVNNQISEINKLNEKCEEKCFPDWVVFDLIFNGLITLEESQNWFVLFKDKNIIEKIKIYKEKNIKKYISEIVLKYVDNFNYTYNYDDFLMMPLREMGMDSLSFVKFVVELEEKYNIEFDYEYLSIDALYNIERIYEILMRIKGKNE